MNKSVTSKEALVDAARAIALEEGLEQLSMRAVATRCHVAVGSVYNYFPSKAELLSQTVRGVWQETFHGAEACMPATDFLACIRWLFTRAREGAGKYPSFFSAHAMGFARDERALGRAVMERFFAHMKAGLLNALNHDPRVRTDAFDETLTREALVDFVFHHLLLLLSQGEESCRTLLAVAARASGMALKEKMI